MRILILGGTRFLGRALVEAALQRDHAVTLFNRGTHAGLYPQVEELHGDRTRDLSALDGRRWDVAIDTSGYFPRVARMSAEKLAGAVEHYTFVSSISAYADYHQPEQDESYPVARLPGEIAEEITETTYGPLKVLCEEAVQGIFGERAFVPRPGLIVGMYDPTDRFTYWPHRVAQGGEVLAPDDPHRPVQFIDVRDLADWMLSMAEQRVGGVFNATGPEAPLPMGDLLAACQGISGSQASIAWLPETFLLSHRVEPWSDLPLWLPRTDPDSAGFSNINCAKARAAGLTYRPLEITIRETLAWDAMRPADYVLRAGLTREREAELLAIYRQVI